MNTFRLAGQSYDEFSKHMTRHGIDTRPMFYPIHRHAHLANISAESNDIRHSEIAMLPSYPSLEVYDQVYITHATKQFLRGQDLRIERVTPTSTSILKAFIEKPMPETFRYFKTRTIDDCLRDHSLTLVGCIDGDPVAYAHLDQRWLGVCILPQYQSKGYGSLLVDFILNYADLSGIAPVRLSVDKFNTLAISMYTKRGFRHVRETDTIYFMERHTDD